MDKRLEQEYQQKMDQIKMNVSKKSKMRDYLISVEQLAEQEAKVSMANGIKENTKEEVKVIKVELRQRPSKGRRWLGVGFVAIAACFLVLLMVKGLMMNQTAGLDENVVATQTPGATDDLTQDLQACYMPLSFDSEEQLIETINTVRDAKDKENTTDRISIKSKTAGQQTYSVDDMFKLASVSEFYRPSMLHGMSLNEIHVINEYVSYDYVIKSQSEKASFTWFREMSPEVAMNDLYGRGSISERELQYKGNEYVLLEFADRSGKSSGYSIHWVVNDIAFGASIPSGYTDEEMLEFCQFEAIKVMSIDDQIDIIDINKDDFEETNKDGFIIHDEKLKDVAVAKADINNDCIEERIALDLSVFDGAQPAYLKIYNDENRIIYEDQLFHASAGKKSIYLYESEGKHYLLEYIPNMQQGGCKYEYKLFYLDVNNSVITVDHDSIWFDINKGYGELHVESMKEFYDKTNDYLSKSVLIISTMNDDIEYSTETNQIKKREDYTFLNVYEPDLSFSDDDSILVKLQRFNEYIQSEHYQSENLE